MPYEILNDAVMVCSL